MAELNDYQPIDDAIKSLSNGKHAANGQSDLPDWLRNELNIHRDIEPVVKPKRENDLRWIDSFNQPKSTPQQIMPTMRMEERHNAPLVNTPAPVVESAVVQEIDEAEEAVGVKPTAPAVSMREERIEGIEEVVVEQSVNPLETPEDPDEYMAWLKANAKKKVVVKSAEIDHLPLLNREERIQPNGNGKHVVNMAVESQRVNTKSELGWMKNYFNGNGVNGKAPAVNGNGKTVIANGNGHMPDAMAWLDELAEKDGKAIREELSD